MATSFINKYIGITFSYSALRKLYYTYDSEYKVKINDIIYTQPILYSDRFLYSIYAGIIGIYIAPFNLSYDINHLELYMRNIKKLPDSDYNKIFKNVNFLNILFDNHYD